MVRLDNEALITETKRKVNMMEKRGLVTTIQRQTILNIINSNTKRAEDVTRCN
jgi:Fe2+ or Zn2+ uptake regulation protein